jgi:hypothetical protein
MNEKIAEVDRDDFTTYFCCGLVIRRDVRPLKTLIQQPRYELENGAAMGLIYTHTRCPKEIASEIAAQKP